MLWRMRAFLKGLSTTRTGTLGVALTTSSFLLLVFLLLLQAAGVLGNSYAGLLTFLALPGVFVAGLLLIPVGWRRLQRRTGLSTAELLRTQFPPGLVQASPFGSSLALTIAGLTVVNLLFLGFGGAAILHHMDTPEFCGTTCHAVMNPEWVTYQSSPHAHVPCVECHVGEGADALIDAKLNGLRQMWLVTVGGYRRPIPTPVTTLRPARETCEKCHWPDKFYGDRIKTIARFAADEQSTPRFTTLALKVGAGGQAGKIHWHVAADNEVRYQALDESRLVIDWVEVKRGDRYHRFTNRRAIPRDAAPPAARTLDCIDCHNRATHVYRQAEDVVDELLADGTLDRTLPWAKAAALAAIATTVPRDADREAAIAGALRAFYRRQDPRALARHPAGLDEMARALAAAHARNVHPQMNVDWGTYPSHLGHRQGRAGCFRCHNQDLVDDSGRAISSDCTLCHSLLAFESPSPFQYLEPVRPAQPDSAMHVYLQAEFTGRAP
ncbi:MAG TPA: NapC/NirT family cytochrome c [Candidatus Krumholzibacteria bacterium]|nr:NapC/NirT family cytochrome c [Candidatus Krumholzibacteria bacterium]HPD72645.1 NapC/NirT family cytochrome c [Candidatus Krumholzibacteria bacterium]HRY40423.1 NapC/NirT family cytochrome c [Candidatus Krumholzibacteria bacterium]